MGQIEIATRAKDGEDRETHGPVNDKCIEKKYSGTISVFDRSHE